MIERYQQAKKKNIFLRVAKGFFILIATIIVVAIFVSIIFCSLWFTNLWTHLPAGWRAYWALAKIDYSTTTYSACHDECSLEREFDKNVIASVAQVNPKTMAMLERYILDDSSLDDFRIELIDAMGMTQQGITTNVADLINKQNDSAGVKAKVLEEMAKSSNEDLMTVYERIASDVTLDKSIREQAFKNIGASDFSSEIPFLLDKVENEKDPISYYASSALVDMTGLVRSGYMDRCKEIVLKKSVPYVSRIDMMDIIYVDKNAKNTYLKICNDLSENIFIRYRAAEHLEEIGGSCNKPIISEEQWNEEEEALYPW